MIRWPSLMLGASLLATFTLPAEAARHVVVIQNMAFGPAPAHLDVGDTIVWQNKDIFRHSATARSGGFDVDLAPGKEGETTLKRVGEVDVFCRYHPTMRLKLMVTAKEH